MIRIICKECGAVQEELRDLTTKDSLIGVEKGCKRCLKCDRLLDWKDATLKIRTKGEK